MSPTIARLLAWSIALGAAASAHAQEQDDEAPVFTGEEDEDEAPVFTGEEQDSAEGEDEVSDAQEQPQADTSEWDLPRVLVVQGRRTPVRLARAVLTRLESIGEVVAGTEYAREARARGYPPTSQEAFEQILPDLDVDLVLVVEGARVRGRPYVRVTYREGKLGFVLLEEVHPLAGFRVSEEVGQRIVSETRLALAATTRPRGGPKDAGEEAAGGEAAAVRPPVGPERAEEPPAEPGAAVHVALAAGVGVGTRAFEVPTAPGDVRLTTSPFPAASLRLRLDVEPVARGRLSLGGELRYLTSVGLRTTDRRVDGTNRETSSRSQRLDLSARLRWRFADALDAVSLEARLGYAFRLFSSEAPVTLPDFGLSGPALAVGLRFPLLDGVVELAALPTVHWIAVVGDSLEREGVRSQAVAVGGEASVRVLLSGPFYLEGLYRESHALLSSPRGSAGDVERFGVLQAVYRP